MRMAATSVPSHKEEMWDVMQQGLIMTASQSANMSEPP